MSILPSDVTRNKLYYCCDQPYYRTSQYEETCNSDVRLHVVSPLVCVLSARKLEGVNTVMSATMPMQR